MFRVEGKDLMGREKPPLYVTPNCGIQVVGEHATPAGYVICYIRPHPFFASKHVRRNRIVMADKLGRPLHRNEHVHHENGDRGDDRPENLHLMLAHEHNSHHKTGSRHRPESRAKIGQSLRAAYENGRRTPVSMPENLADWNAKVRSGEVVPPWRKDARNAALIAFHTKSRSLTKTGAEFGLTPDGVLYVVKKYAPHLVRRYHRRTNPCAS